MRSFTLISAIFVATTALASPLGNRQDSETTFRFLGSVYCLVPTDPNVYTGPCPVDQQVQLPFDETGTALTEVVGHSINVTIAPYGSDIFNNYHVVSGGKSTSPPQHLG
jgi:hypothetical protein